MKPLWASWPTLRRGELSLKEPASSAVTEFEGVEEERAAAMP